MTDNCLSDRSGYGRTFNTAMWIAGSIAVLQLLALGFGVVKRPPVLAAASPLPPANETLPSAPVASTPAPLSVPAAEAPTDMNAIPGPAESLSTRGVSFPEQLESGPAVPVNQGRGEFSAPGSMLGEQNGKASSGPVPAGSVLPTLPAPSFEGPAALSGSPSLSAALTLAARENELAGEPILERLMSTGAELRASGNMQGALQAFREVESAMPEHPRILSELAATLGEMGLSDKANSYWERVEGLGPVVAAAYFPIAGRQLRGEPPASSDTISKIVKIGEVKVEEQAPTSEGQKVIVRVVVDAAPDARPVGNDLTLLVYFYDQVAGGGVKPSTANTSYVYPSPPYDWLTDGTEEIIVNYNQPVFTDEQKRELGERSYYGYAIELYYRDQIQDKLIMPENIAKLRLDARDETVPDGGFIGPENALFPDSAYP